jgi:hypothetical protein
MGKGESIPVAVSTATRGAGTPSVEKVLVDIRITFDKYPGVAHSNILSAGIHCTVEKNNRDNWRRHQVMHPFADEKYQPISVREAFYRRRERNMSFTRCY